MRTVTTIGLQEVVQVEVLIQRILRNVDEGTGLSLLVS